MMPIEARDKRFDINDKPVEANDRTILHNPAFDRMIQAAKGQLRRTDEIKSDQQGRTSSSRLTPARG